MDVLFEQIILAKRKHHVNVSSKINFTICKTHLFTPDQKFSGIISNAVIKIAAENSTYLQPPKLYILTKFHHLMLCWSKKYFISSAKISANKCNIFPERFFLHLDSRHFCILLLIFHYREQLIV